MRYVEWIKTDCVDMLGNCSHDYAVEWEKGKMCSYQRIHCESVPYRTIAQGISFQPCHPLNGLSCSMNPLPNSTCDCFYRRSFCQRLEKKTPFSVICGESTCDNVMISDDGSFNIINIQWLWWPRLNRLDQYLIRSSRPSDKWQALSSSIRFSRFSAFSLLRRSSMSSSSLISEGHTK